MSNSQFSIRNYQFSMSNGAYKQKEIYDRIDKFILKVLSLIRALPKELINLEISRQLIKSATSVGANSREAQAAQSKREFIHCFSISKKESKETWYWLSLLSKLNPKLKTVIDGLIKECDELTAIISSIVSSARKNPQKIEN